MSTMERIYKLFGGEIIGKILLASAAVLFLFLLKKRGEMVVNRSYERQRMKELERLNHEADLITAQAIANRPADLDAVRDRLRSGSF